MSFCVTSSARKARRKQEREQKKQKKQKGNPSQGKNKSKDEPTTTNNNNSDLSSKRKASPTKSERSLGKKARRSPSFHISNDPYASLPPDVAAALRRDDDEIADLESKLGLSGGGGRDGKSRLNQDYAKKECFGDDFGSFLDDLDGLIQRVIASPTTTTTTTTSTTTEAAAASDESSDDSEDNEDASHGDTENTSDSENVEKYAAE